jgi:hypothetical protein
MGASACVNVETSVVLVEARALMAAKADGMVSAACVLAGKTVDDAYVPMHAVSLRVIAADKRSMPGLETGVCDGVTRTAAGGVLECVSTQPHGVSPRVDTADDRRQHVSDAAAGDTGALPAGLVSVTTRDYT